MDSEIDKTRNCNARQASLQVLDVVLPRSAGKLPEVPGGKLFPVVRYETALARARIGRSRVGLTAGPAGATFFQLVLRSSVGNAPVAGAVASLRLKGASSEIKAVSDAAGTVTFGLRAPSVTNAVLLVEPGFGGHWGHFNRKITLASGDVVVLDAVDLTLGPDALRHLMRPGQAADGAGVTVAVIDTGVGPHLDLPNIVGDADTSFGHGTHVAGIIAGKGAAANAGVAQGAAIRSYRVFSDPATGIAKNFDIHKAIEAAVSDGCHIINLSLKVERQIDPMFNDVVISTALEDPADAGVLIVAAAGNDFRRFVAFPARHPDVISVAAVGWEPGLPASAYDRWTVSRDRGAPNADIFFASFSNEGVDGTNIDVAAPGAGIISTVPGDRYAPMSGTSMACPAAVGAIARLLSANPAVMAMPPDRARRNAIWALAQAQLSPLGFGRQREGAGMIR